MKSKLLLILTLLIALLIVRNGSDTFYDHPDRSSQTYQDEIPVGELEGAKRDAAIKKCASCHQDVYINWMLGPHANAHRALEDHFKLVNQSPSFPHTYRSFLQKHSSICITCHTGTNLYETSFAGLESESNPACFSTEVYPEMESNPISRQSGLLNMNSGVDCLTCHVVSDQVVTNANFEGSMCDLMDSKPIASTFFSTNKNCGNCHKHQVKSMERLLGEGKIGELQSCNGCHQETTDENKPTHYYYWRHDPSSKPRPSHLNLFQGINFVIYEEESGWSLNFCWQNDFVPHDFSECGDAMVTVKVYDSNGRLIAQLEQWLNRKEELFNQYGAKHMKLGKDGNTFRYLDEPMTLNSFLQENPINGRVEITGKVKAQYWSSVDELETVYQEEIPVRIFNR